MAFKIKKSLPSKETDTRDGEDSILEGSVLGRPEDNLPGVESVDRVVLASENAFDWMHKNRKPLLGGLAVVVVGMLAVAGLRSSANEARADEAQTLYRAYASSIAPIGEDLEPSDVYVEGDPTFTSVRDQLLAVQSQTAPLIEDAKGGPAAFAQLLHGSVTVQLGDAGGADSLQNFDDFATTPLQRGVASSAMASVTAAQGDLAGAVQRLDALAATNPTLAPGVLEQRASLIETYGEGQDAIEAWRVAFLAAEGTESEARVADRIAMLELRHGAAAPAAGNAPTNTDAQEGE